MTLVQVDPATLIVGANVRLDARLDKDFIDSVRQRGVKVPIVGYRDDHGQIVVLYGQRRTLAAVQTGRPTVPVVITTEQDEADRLVDQLAENHHRAALTTHEDAKAFHQLAALGVPAGAIAKRTARPKGVVDAALAVAGSEVAQAATQKWEFLDLTQAAAIAEFDGDDEAVKVLVMAAENGRFQHELQQLRDERESKRQQDALIAELTGKGLKVIDRPGTMHPQVASLKNLKIGARKATEATHKKCKGHAAFVHQDYVVKDGKGGYEWVVGYACTNYPRYEHTHAYVNGAGLGERPKLADMDPEEAEQARAERRDVIQSNKAWDSALKVRQAWLKEFATRKTPPKTAAAFIAKAIASCDHQIRTAMEGSHKFARDLVGVEHESFRSDHHRGQLLVDLCTSEGRAQMLTLVMILAAYEENLPRDAWRRSDPGPSEYLRFIESEGYELSDVEKRARDGGKKP
ncbi:ParB N-terminal domain-containing protein [Micromonospora lupini]|uniref:ParB/RepB/Spo0J family partition protein n=1 Tax=Micromonospora lupini TaxID=285679 RepID=UPI0022540F1A|nr:ParB N-terminal domain-containing protein [Micromonospora lupini]MCX5070879.1 ParB N-terminal domain-containing protein [Micromonospora lupini]